MHSSEEAYLLLAEIRKIVRYLGICDGNMEEGSLRCDANVSVMPKGSATLGKKVEVKNMNSLRNVQRAVDHEIERQIALLEGGEPVVSETRLFDAATGRTSGMRTKEELNDYRYFPDPDLSPVEVSDEWLERVRSEMPALPRQLFQRLVEHYKLPAYDAHVLTESPDVVRYFEAVCGFVSNAKAVSNWVMGPVKSALKELGVAADQFPLRPELLGELIGLVEEGRVSHTAASQTLFVELVKNPDQTAGALAERLDLIQERDHSQILPIVEEVLKEFPLKVEEFKKGKKGIISMFMGEVMKRSKGRADPRLANELITKKLTEV